MMAYDTKFEFNGKTYILRKSHASKSVFEVLASGEEKKVSSAVRQAVLRFLGYIN